jgi:hypothetical protein
MGNGAETVNYIAEGEASDWMLDSMGIIAMSPELGDYSRASESFFLRRAEDI